MDVPKLIDWKTQLQDKLSEVGNSKEDMIQIINTCDSYLKEMQEIGKWFSDCQQFITQIRGNLGEMYRLRFNSEPIPQSQPVLPGKLFLNNPSNRQQYVREIALAITQVGSEINCESILKELDRRSIELKGSNLNAIIGTIMNGYRSNFKKVEGKRGVFLRIK